MLSLKAPTAKPPQRAQSPRTPAAILNSFIHLVKIHSGRLIKARSRQPAHHRRPVRHHPPAGQRSPLASSSCRRARSPTGTAQISRIDS
ncbi:MAG: hypothetical protein MZV64_23920 [Ignavibacteriales bacterium]|nr:hypothetical protein [Ignavibacteriales bacterium]